MLCKIVFVVTSCLIVVLAQEMEDSNEGIEEIDYTAKILLPYENIQYQPFEKHFCVKGTACGWGILKARSKTDVQYYMRTSCTCDDELRCMKNNIDVYLMAQVYRCDVYSPLQTSTISLSSLPSSSNTASD